MQQGQVSVEGFLEKVTFVLVDEGEPVLDRMSLRHRVPGRRNSLCTQAQNGLRALGKQKRNVSGAQRQER